jgi:hypothetical protein
MEPVNYAGNKLMNPDEPGGPKSDPEEEGCQSGGTPAPVQCPSCGQYMGSPGHMCP